MTNNGGADEIEPVDPLLAKQVLSQLSYSPFSIRTDTSLAARLQFFELRLAKSMWWAWVDLNYRPHAYQACALTT